MTLLLHFYIACAIVSLFGQLHIQCNYKEFDIINVIYAIVTSIVPIFNTMTAIAYLSYLTVTFFEMVSVLWEKRK